MDTKFGEWYRTAHIEPDDKLLKMRWKGVETFSTNLTPSRLLDLARLFHTRPPRDTNFQKEFRTSFFQADNAFKMQGNDLELAVLAGATLACVLNGKDSALSDVAAFATVCPCLQGKARTATIPDVQNRARNYLVSRSGSLRASAGKKRKLISVPQIDESLKAISDACNANALTNVSGPLTDFLRKLGMTMQKVIQSTNQIQHDQLLLREESDVLWWMQGRYSLDLKMSMDQIGLAAASIIAGKELAELTKVLPGPFAARAILHQILLREDPDIESEVALSSAVNESDRGWRQKWAQSFAQSEAIDLCPISFAVKTSLEIDSAKGWFAAFKKTTTLGASIKIEPVGIATQVYEESLFIRSFKGIGEA